MTLRPTVALAFSVATLLGATMQPHQAVAASRAAGSCSRASTLQAAWVTSGTWSADGTELFLADARNHLIRTYLPSGSSLAPASSPLGAAVAGLSPSILKVDSVTHGLLLEVEGSQRLLQLDRDYTQVANHLVQISPPSARPDNLAIYGLFQWQPAGGLMYAFSDIQGPKDTDWSSGVVRYPVGRPDQFTILRHVRLGDFERTLYRLGYQYFTSIGPAAFILSMERAPSIYKATQTSQGLIPVGGSLRGLETAPELPTLRTYEDLAPVMAAVEHSTMPVAIQAWEGYLYVLARYYERDATSWKLLRIDPSSGAVTAGPTSLPSTANHLMMVPGPLHWAFVEKGPVTGFGLQEIKSILYVPSDLMRGSLAASPCKD